MNDRQANDIAVALCTVQDMKDQLDTCHATIGQLKADLRAEQNKSALLDEERKTWRSDATLLRSKLIELATIQSNIGLLTRASDEILKASHVIDENTTAPDVLNRLAGEILPAPTFNTISDELPPGDPVEALQSLTRVASR